MEQGKNKEITYINGLVSIIMPAYNAQNHIEEAIESVIAQTYKNWELIIINDYSSDNTLSIVKSKYANEKRISIYTLEKNSGVASARNVGLDLSRGRYIAFLDADDFGIKINWSNKYLFLMRSGEYFLATSYDTVSDDGTRLKVFLADGSVTYLSQLKGSRIGCLTVIIDRKRTGGFYFQNAGHEDYILWQYLLEKFGSGYIMPEILATYRISSNSLSSDKFKMVKWQYLIYRNNCKMGIFKSLFYLSHYGINGLRKYSKIKESKNDIV